MASERFVPIRVAGDDALWCGVAGDGPAVVFLHGFSVDAAMWDDQVAALANRMRTVRYDLRGFGRSGLPDPERDHVDDLAGLLDELDIARAVLVGLSLGANVALALAAAHPERVRAAMLASPGLPGRAWTTPRPPDLALEHARTHGVEATRRFWSNLPLLDATRDRPAAFARLSAMLDRFPGHQWSDRPQSRPLPMLADSLELISLPVTVVSGDRDDAGYLDVAVEIATRVPGATRVVVAGAGHFVNLDEPAAFDSALADVLDRADSVDAGAPR